jgi:hypothetical protein
MEQSDQEVEEIDPPVIKWNKRKKYQSRILIEPLDPFFLSSQQKKCSQRAD